VRFVFNTAIVWYGKKYYTMSEDCFPKSFDVETIDDFDVDAILEGINKNVPNPFFKEDVRMRKTTALPKYSLPSLFIVEAKDSSWSVSYRAEE